MKTHSLVALSALVVLLGACAMPEPIPQTCEFACNSMGPDGAPKKDTLSREMGWSPDAGPPPSHDGPARDSIAKLGDGLRRDGLEPDGLKPDVKRDGLTEDGLTRDGLERDGLTQDSLTLDGTP